MPFTGGAHLQLKKMQSIEVKQRISNFFSYNVDFAFQKISNSQNILRKINFYIKTIKANSACQIFQ